MLAAMKNFGTTDGRKNIVYGVLGVFANVPIFLYGESLDALPKSSTPPAGMFVIMFIYLIWFIAWILPEIANDDLGVNTHWKTFIHWGGISIIFSFILGIVF